jgi:hypothetical protein
MRAHEVELELRRVRGVDLDRGQVAEAGRHAVHDGARGDHGVHGLAPAHDALARVGREWGGCAAARDALQLGESEDGGHGGPILRAAW